MSFAVLIDFGSTYTKVVCVDLDERKIVITGNFASTVHEDACIGLHQCFDLVKNKIGESAFNSAIKLSSSSAAGGLRMAVCGLTDRLSFLAGRNTAFGAGGKIISSASGLLSPENISDLEQSDTEIMLFCGGYEHGNQTLVRQNIKTICESKIDFPIIYAGNSDLQDEVYKMITESGKECILADNVIPDVGELNKESAEEVIRDLFMKRIVNMKGMGGAQKELDEILMPTPKAVLTAGTLLSEGTATQKGLGKVMMLDIGGATTDVYSFNNNKGYKGAKLAGAKEPFAKRTVEGDMGMRESSICVINEVGEEALANEAGVSIPRINEAVKRRITEKSYISDTEEEWEIDQAIARTAAAVSVRRHAGYIERVSIGGRYNQYGKNLTVINTIIGTGGVIVNNDDPSDILRSALLKEGEREDTLIPREADLFVDKDYVFYAAGLLKSYDEEAAFSIMKNSLVPVQKK